MYPEYSKVKEYLDTAKDLYNTSQTMEDIFNMFTTRHAKRVAAIFYNEKGKLKRYKYKHFKANVVLYASILKNKLNKVSNNSVVVLKLANSPKWGEFFWAILMAGFTPLLIDAKTQKEGTNNLIKQSKAVAIICDDPYDFDVTKLTVKEITSSTASINKTTWGNEVIFCSSGTTGDVKLMVFNGKNIVNQITASLDIPETSKDIMYPKKMGDVRNLCMIPFHHVFGFVAIFLWYTFYGKTLVYPNSINSTEIQNLCQKAKVTHLFSVPLFWDSLALNFERKIAQETEERQKLINNAIKYNLKEINKEEAGPSASKTVLKVIQSKILGKNIRFCISGGGYLNSHTASIINGIGYNLYNGFGMTELGVTSVELSPKVEDRLKGSIGKPFHGIEYKIVKANEKDATGELFVKSGTTHVREIIGGKESTTTLDKEGYFATGDIAEVDNDGRYYIKGRSKDIIINANGENIFPDELEIYFKSIDKVKNVCVTGVKKSNTTNEDIVLVLEIDNSITEDELIEVKKQVAEIGANLPKGTKIDRLYFSRGRLPLANNMKVKRFQVKKAIEANSSDYINTEEKKKPLNYDGYNKEDVSVTVNQIKQIFSEVLVLPIFKIDDDSHWINDLGGDSMNYVEMVSKVDDKFGIQIEEEKYGQLTCVRDFVIEVLNKTKKK